MRVLITSPRGKENLVKAFESCSEVVSDLSALPDLIIPTVDEELPFFAANKAWFDAHEIAVMVGSDFTISTCRDKAEFYRFCKRHQFTTPATMQGFFMVKPRFGKASKGVIKVDRSYIVQEFCPFPEVSIDYVADSSGEVISLIPRYRLGIVNGASTEMQGIPDFNFTQVKRLGKELGLVGHNVIQGYWTGDTFIFGEVNPRYGGGSHLTFDIFNSPKWLVEHYVSTRGNNTLHR